MRLGLPIVCAFAIAWVGGPWQTPGPFETPGGHWQSPGPIQVPRGIQAITWHTRGCTQTFVVGADALFAFDESTLSPDADKTLAALGPLIRKNAPDHTVRVDGYTDAIGSDAYNMTLSLARAKTVRDWLAKDGDIGQSTAIEGHGKENPVAPNTHPDGSDDPAGRQKNRRVEVVILGCTR